MDRPSKILGIVGSSRKNGNTELLVRTALEGAGSIPAIETELLLLHGKNLQPCNVCSSCWNKEQGICTIKDDAEEVIARMLAADGIVMGTPVYFGGVSALLKALMERCLKLNVLEDQSLAKRPYDEVRHLPLYYPMRNKVGGAVAVGGAPSGGQERAIADIHAFYMILDMIVVSDGGIRTPACHPHFGGVGIGNRRREVQNDEYAMKSSYSLGIRVAEASALIQAGLRAVNCQIG